MAYRSQSKRLLRSNRGNEGNPERHHVLSCGVRGVAGLLSLDNHATSNACARIAGGLGFVVVWVLVNDDASAHDAGGTISHRHACEVKFCRRFAVRIGLQRGHVATVMVSILGAVGLARGVEMSACADAVGRGAIALVMDVKTVFLPWLEARHIHHRHHMVALLHELDGAGHGRSATGFQLTAGAGAMLLHAHVAARCNGQQQGAHRGQFDT